MGCSFWGVVMQNEVSDVFRGNARDGGQGTNASEFGFVFLASPGADATVTVSRIVQGSVVSVSTTTVPGGATRSVVVPWQSPRSAGVTPYGYFISSTRPVMAWQFNPLTPRISTATPCSIFQTCSGGLDCITISGAQTCGAFAYSVDSSLLLPAHALGTSYVLTTNEHVRLGTSDDLPTQAVVVATQNGTQVTVRASATARLSSGTQTLGPNGTTTITLNAYDVLQLESVVGTASSIECVTNPFNPTGGMQLCRFQSDLSGSVVTASAPIAVFAGAPCALRPYSAVACDHLEEQLAPVSTWGTSYVLTRGAAPRAGDAGLPSPNPAPFIVKITAACPAATCPSGTRLTFSDPPMAGRIIGPSQCQSGQLSTNDCRLPAGASAEFQLSGSTMLTTDAPVQVVEFIPGQSATPGANEGDPSMVVIPPSSQWELNPSLVVVPQYGRSFARLTWVGSATVAVDGTPVVAVAVPNSQAFWALVSLLPGPHQVTSSTPVGVDVHAYDAFVSYAMGAGRRFAAQDAGFVP